MSDDPQYVIPIHDERQLVAHANTVYDLVWRVDFKAPGFAVLDIPPGPDSHVLRAWMVKLKQRLTEIGISRKRGGFIYKSMSRFDQQVTTKFHLDGAPDQSLLMLGYEPSKVESRLFLADYTRAAFDLGITPGQFLQEYNPMYKKGEDLLGLYITELPQPMEGHSRLVAINNSSLPFSEVRTNSLGVLHKAIIVTPDDTERRFINSTMLAVGERDEISLEQQKEFIATDKISQRDY
ncbi:MAG: hypothetical protein LC104_21830 [Bacteroidales bacterium]|nr:hypothetical protein [Bacteroidales bacterium]